MARLTTPDPSPPSSPDFPETQTQFVPASNDSDDLFPAICVLDEAGTQYLVAWSGVDPSTKQPWEPSWEPKRNVTNDLIQEWKEKKAENKRIKGKWIKQNQGTPLAKKGESLSRRANREQIRLAREASVSKRARSVTGKKRKRAEQESDEDEDEEEPMEGDDEEDSDYEEGRRLSARKINKKPRVSVSARSSTRAKSSVEPSSKKVPPPSAIFHSKIPDPPPKRASSSSSNYSPFRSPTLSETSNLGGFAGSEQGEAVAGPSRVQTNRSVSRDGNEEKRRVSGKGKSDRMLSAERVTNSDSENEEEEEDSDIITRAQPVQSKKLVQKITNLIKPKPSSTSSGKGKVQSPTIIPSSETEDEIQPSDTQEPSVIPTDTASGEGELEHQLSEAELDSSIPISRKSNDIGHHVKKTRVTIHSSPFEIPSIQPKGSSGFTSMSMSQVEEGGAAELKGQGKRIEKGQAKERTGLFLTGSDDEDDDEAEPEAESEKEAIVEREEGAEVSSVAEAESESDEDAEGEDDEEADLNVDGEQLAGKSQYPVDEDDSEDGDDNEDQNDDAGNVMKHRVRVEILLPTLPQASSIDNSQKSRGEAPPQSQMIAHILNDVREASVHGRGEDVDMEVDGGIDQDAAEQETEQHPESQEQPSIDIAKEPEVTREDTMEDALPLPTDDPSSRPDAREQRFETPEPDHPSSRAPSEQPSNTSRFSVISLMQQPSQALALNNAADAMVALWESGSDDGPESMAEEHVAETQLGGKVVQEAHDVLQELQEAGEVSGLVGGEIPLNDGELAGIVADRQPENFDIGQDDENMGMFGLEQQVDGDAVDINIETVQVDGVQDEALTVAVVVTSTLTVDVENTTDASNDIAPVANTEHFANVAIQSSKQDHVDTPAEIDPNPSTPVRRAASRPLGAVPILSPRAFASLRGDLTQAHENHYASTASEPVQSQFLLSQVDSISQFDTPEKGGASTGGMGVQAQTIILDSSPPTNDLEEPRMPTTNPGSVDERMEAEQSNDMPSQELGEDSRGNVESDSTPEHPNATEKVHTVDCGHEATMTDLRAQLAEQAETMVHISGKLDRSEEQGKLLADLLDKAGDSAMTHSRRSHELAAEVQTLKKQIKEGLAVNKSFYESNLKAKEQSIHALSGQVHVLLEQNRRTDDLIRERARKYPGLQQRCKRLEAEHQLLSLQLEETMNAAGQWENRYMSMKSKMRELQGKLPRRFSSVMADDDIDSLETSDDEPQYTGMAQVEHGSEDEDEDEDESDPERSRVKSESFGLPSEEVDPASATGNHHEASTSSMVIRQEAVSDDRDRDPEDATADREPAGTLPQAWLPSPESDVVLQYRDDSVESGPRRLGMEYGHDMENDTVDDMDVDQSTRETGVLEDRKDYFICRWDSCGVLGNSREEMEEHMIEHAV